MKYTVKIKYPVPSKIDSSGNDPFTSAVITDEKGEKWTSKFKEVKECPKGSTLYQKSDFEKVSVAKLMGNENSCDTYHLDKDNKTILGHDEVTPGFNKNHIDELDQRMYEHQVVTDNVIPTIGFDDSNHMGFYAYYQFETEI